MNLRVLRRFPFLLFVELKVFSGIAHQNALLPYFRRHIINRSNREGCALLPTPEGPDTSLLRAYEAPTLWMLGPDSLATRYLDPLGTPMPDTAQDPLTDCQWHNSGMVHMVGHVRVPIQGLRLMLFEEPT